MIMAYFRKHFAVNEYQVSERESKKLCSFVLVITCFIFFHLHGYFYFAGISYRLIRLFYSP